MEMNGKPPKPEAFPGFAELWQRSREIAKPVEWIVQGWIPVGVTNYSGHGESGKTYTMLDLMIAALSGRRWLGLETKELDRVAFLTAEQSLGAIDHRLDVILPKYGFLGKDDETPRQQFYEKCLNPKNKDLFYWSMRGRRPEPFWVFDQPNAYNGYRKDWGDAQFWAELQGYLIDEKVELLIIDSIGHFFWESVADKGKVLYALSSLADFSEDAGCAIVFLFHPTLTGLNAEGPLRGMGGAMEWHNQVDARILLSMDDDGDKRLLEQMKVREGPRQPPVELKWNGHGFGPLKDIDKPDGFILAQKIIADCQRMGQPVSPATGRNYFPGIMSDHPFNRDGRKRLIGGRSKESQKEAWENILIELRRRGLVVVDETWNASRHKVKSFMLTEISPFYQDAQKESEDNAELPF